MKPESEVITGFFLSFSTRPRVMYFQVFGIQCLDSRFIVAEFDWAPRIQVSNFEKGLLEIRHFIIVPSM